MKETLKKTHDHIYICIYVYIISISISYSTNSTPVYNLTAPPPQTKSLEGVREGVYQNLQRGLSGAPSCCQGRVCLCGKTGTQLAPRPAVLPDGIHSGERVSRIKYLPVASGV